MAVFDYVNEAGNYVRLKFRCMKCGKKNETEPREVPDMDKTDTFIHACCTCGTIHTIQLVDDGVNGKGEIIDLPQNKLIECTNIPCEYYTDVDTGVIDIIEGLNTIEKAINEIEKLSSEVQSFLRKMLLVNVLSLLEAYLKTTIVHKILSHEVYRKVYHTAFVHCEKKSIQENLYDTSFQNTNRVKRILKKTFGITYVICPIIENAFDKRHKIVHRNGITIEGQKIEVSKEELLQVVKAVRCVRNDLQAQFIELDAKRITNQ